MIGKKVLTKIVLLLIVLFGVTILTFVYTNLSPVDAAEALAAVSYTHLDVYKRQKLPRRVCVRPPFFRGG